MTEDRKNVTTGRNSMCEGTESCNCPVGPGAAELWESGSMKGGGAELYRGPITLDLLTRPRT